MENKVAAALELWLALIKSTAEKRARAAGVPPVGQQGQSEIIPEEEPELPADEQVQEQGAGHTAESTEQQDAASEKQQKTPPAQE